MVHQGNIYFEHCYGADFDPQIPAAEKEVCWTTWLAHYTRHQPGHRIDFALRRVEGLQMGEAMPPLPGIDPNAPKTDPGDWPPSVGSTGPALARMDGEEPSQEGDGAEIPHGCETICQSERDECGRKCAESRDWCSKLCDREQALCTGGCY